jgi:hypothetical protein
MECFGATKKGPRIAKRLRNMGGMRRLELLTSTVSMRRPAIDSKGVNSRRNRQNRNTRRNLLPNCYQNMASGFGAESWGIGPFTLHVDNLMFACRVTCALRVLALPQKTTSELPKDISRLGASSELFGLPTD